MHVVGDVRVGGVVCVLLCRVVMDCWSDAAFNTGRCEVLYRPFVGPQDFLSWHHFPTAKRRTEVRHWIPWCGSDNRRKEMCWPR